MHSCESPTVSFFFLCRRVSGVRGLLSIIGTVVLSLVSSLQHFKCSLRRPSSMQDSTHVLFT